MSEGMFAPTPTNIFGTQEVKPQLDSVAVIVFSRNIG